MPQLNFHLDVDSLFTQILERKVRELSSGGWVQGPAAEFHQKFLMTTAEHFAMLAHGGTWRGVTWKYFSPNSFGMKRPSGKEIKPGDTILQDTRHLKRSAGATFRSVNSFEAAIETHVSYAADHNYGLPARKPPLPARPFQFFTDDDLEDLREFTVNWLNQ